MKRREILRHLALATAGVSLLPGCFDKDEIYSIASGNIAFGKKEEQFLEALSNLMLPKGDIPLQTPESFARFVSTMVNDCSPKEDIEKYGLGYKEYKLYLAEQFKKNISKLNDTEVLQLFEQLNDSNILTANARFFFERTKELVQHHFTTSEYYLTKMDEYEFVPGRFNGCVPA